MLGPGPGEVPGVVAGAVVDLVVLGVWFPLVVVVAGVDVCHFVGQVVVVHQLGCLF